MEVPYMYRCLLQVKNVKEREMHRIMAPSLPSPLACFIIFSSALVLLSSVNNALYSLSPFTAPLPTFEIAQSTHGNP